MAYICCPYWSNQPKHLLDPPFSIPDEIIIQIARILTECLLILTITIVQKFSNLGNNVHKWAAARPLFLVVAAAELLASITVAGKFLCLPVCVLLLDAFFFLPVGDLVGRRLTLFGTGDVGWGSFFLPIGNNFVL